METLKLVLIITQLVVSVALTLIVMLQSGKEDGLSGAIAGGSSDSFLSKNKGATRDAKLAKATKWVAVVFMVLTLTLCLL